MMLAESSWILLVRAIFENESLSGPKFWVCKVKPFPKKQISLEGSRSCWAQARNLGFVLVFGLGIVFWGIVFFLIKNKQDLTQSNLTHIFCSVMLVRKVHKTIIWGAFENELKKPLIKRQIHNVFITGWLGGLRGLGRNYTEPLTISPRGNLMFLSVVRNVVELLKWWGKPWMHTCRKPRFF